MELLLTVSVYNILYSPLVVSEPNGKHIIVSKHLSFCSSILKCSSGVFKLKWDQQCYKMSQF